MTNSWRWSRDWQEKRRALVETDCVAGHVRLELGNVVPKRYRLNIRRTPWLCRTFRVRDFSRVSCERPGGWGPAHRPYVRAHPGHVPDAEPGTIDHNLDFLDRGLSRDGGAGAFPGSDRGGFKK
jgi:hypothetical protein